LLTLCFAQLSGAAADALAKAKATAEALKAQASDALHAAATAASSTPAAGGEADEPTHPGFFQIAVA
jgi:hypothetical protein